MMPQMIPSKPRPASRRSDSSEDARWLRDRLAVLLTAEWMYTVYVNDTDYVNETNFAKIFASSEQSR